MFDHPRTEPGGPGARVAALLRRAGLFEVSPVALAGIGIIVIGALLVAGWRLGAVLSDGADTGFTYEPAGGSEGPSPLAGDATSVAPDVASQGIEAVPATVWVHVAGAVLAPGLRELPSGSRVGDAVDAAGGPTPDASIDTVNLARVVGDGEHIYIPTTEQVASGTMPVAAPAGATASAAAGAGVDINSAGADELNALPGVGPATAAKIIADRDANGPFKVPEDIMRVAGIGEKKFEAMRELIVVR